MPGKIDIDASEVDDALDDILAAIEALPEQFAEELTTWQTEDMHRRFPQTDQPDPNTAATDVYPRSRTWHRPATGNPVGRPRRSTFLRVPRNNPSNRAAPHGGRQTGVHSTRPILRHELFEQLSDRIGDLLTRLKVIS